MTRQNRGLFILFVFLFSCPPVESLDEGFVVAEDGTELYPGALPFWVEGDETVPAGLLEDTATWWNETLDCEVLRLGPPSQVTVTVGYVSVPPDLAEGEGEPMGVTVVDYASDGQVVGAEVTLSSDIAYDSNTLLQVARHELGHAAFGLADDPGPPMTVDLRSIMSSPMDPLGVLTAHDRNIIEPYLYCQ